MNVVDTQAEMGHLTAKLAMIFCEIETLCLVPGKKWTNHRKYFSESKPRPKMNARFGLKFLHIDPFDHAEQNQIKL